ncbi:Gfo/Idh/MocA family protein [Pseudalkalibacillus sp. A8]|uniref:Gfo/Idh/MocA family protein n=1 Tax=Pseudalkalibacillus sp. A8 TaxID=3382641 RepID=UPI0038B53C80
MEQVKIGIIGTGGISYVHGKQLQELAHVKIGAVADPSEKKRGEFITKLNLENAEQFSDYSAMIEQVNLDAVVICSPHTLHFKQATECLEAGLHVLVEKPMTCSSSEATRLIETANKEGKILQVSYQRHFQPEFLFIKEFIKQGKIGKLTSVNASLYQDWKPLTENTWRQNPALSGGGMLMDSGSHIIDILLWTTGLQPQEARTNIEMRDCDVEINSFTTLRFPDGLIGSLNIVGDAPCWHETYVFVGEFGAIFYDNGRLTIRYLNEEPVSPELSEQTTNQDKNFIDALLGLGTDYVKGEFALRVVQLTEKIYKEANYQPII